MITQQPKSLESPNIIGIKLVTVEHPKTSNKLSKTIRQSKVADAGNNFATPLYCETTKRENILVKKKMQKTRIDLMIIKVMNVLLMLIF